MTNSQARDKVYETHSVINDILYEAERGKISWEDAFYQTKSEFFHITEGTDAISIPIFQTKWVWDDVMAVVHAMDKEAFTVFHEFDYEDQNDIAEEVHDDLGKCFSYGIMDGWTEIMQVAIDESGLIKAIRRKWQNA